MFEFLQNWIGNAFLRFIIVFVVGFVVVRFILHFLEKLTLALTVRTKTKLDDLIVQKTSKPLTFLVLALVLKISLEQLSFPENIDLIISRIVTSIIIIFAFYLGYVIIDLILFKGGRQYVLLKRIK